ncbi:hypothetical protein ACJVDH_19305 [Pedobacter sp. AW1-32]|uniref:hypothetical protein n=1 Tax=Pedobacter sp. AW1-32 TaxID=3383026 RepID=UPI003FEE7136
MKRFRILIYLAVVLAIAIGACTTGKKALQKGNYDASVSKSVNRLQGSPKNAEAIEVLKSAYPLALENHLRRIDEAKLSTDLYRWESVIADYQQINQLADEINSCPACLTLVGHPAKYIKELNDSKYNAAAARYNSGLNYLNTRTKIAAKKAYFEFEKTLSLWPNYVGAKEKMDDAYWAAVTQVVVQPIVVNRGYYKLSANYFQQQIDQYIATYSRNRFVLFYSEEDATDQKIIPDQVLSLNFDDFVVGQTYVKERVEKLKRDSVVVGETRDRKPIYGTVKATLSVFEKQVGSTGVLDLTITDWKTHTKLRQQKFNGSYIWKDAWATYKGDDRALDKQQLAWTNKRELLPPSANALFLEFTKPIYSQLVNYIGGFYDGY